ncbi:hypothetical protein CR159_13825 [Pollutimonas subterranea]|uniref:DUF3325 domain-containing protein n=1 Tax=Pollutimonas subterranea TaxID=2045210 RepID=A0A2N4U2Z6_9BURK|nr:DUF3325 domain-containing protein [Pollutimonas subterranea]PLC49373.1 hypothetical protein CR159_13825 [Pollutimonas subterranea]
MTYLGMLLLSVLAFACLALAMERHQEDMFGRLLSSRVTKLLRTAGWVLLCGSLAVALRQPLWSMGLVAWFGCLTAGAGVVFIVLMLRDRPRAGHRLRG